MRTRVQLLTDLRNLRRKVTDYEIHCKQYENQRSRNSKVEQSMPVGEVGVTRDFVNDHAEDGSKVADLVLVCKWRTHGGGELHTLNLHHFSKRESCDAYFVADVFDYQLHQPDEHHMGFLSQFSTIHLWGDHGPHFSGSVCVYKESEFCHTYDKRILVDFFCSYHAFGPADSAGSVYKRLNKRLCRYGCGPRTAEVPVV